VIEEYMQRRDSSQQSRKLALSADQK